MEPTWHVTKFPNQVYHLVINTSPGYEFEQTSNYQFSLNGNEMTLPKFLPALEDGFFLRSELLDKSQINIFYIPIFSCWVTDNLKKVVADSYHGLIETNQNPVEFVDYPTEIANLTLNYHNQMLDLESKIDHLKELL